MSLSASMATVSAANASIAADAAHRAKVSECKVIEHSFDSKIASISEKTEYADCMNVLYPQAMSGDMTLFLKVLFVIGLVSAIYVFVKEIRVFWNYGDAFFISVLWGIGVPSVVAFIAGIFMGISWVFS